MKFTQTKLIFLTAVFFVTFDNLAFFSHVLEVYPPTLKNLGFLLSLAVGLLSVIVLVLTLVSFRYTVKPILVALLFTSAVSGYFMNNYSTVVDVSMIRNIVETSVRESVDLLSPKLFAYLLFLGVLPAFFVYMVEIKRESWLSALITKFKTVTVCALLVMVLILCFSKFYTSFFREHKPLRYYTNPTYSIYSAGKYIGNRLKSSETVLAVIGEDAKIPETDEDRELIIMVIGEAARADHFYLNGYSRNNNPLLAEEDVISLSSMYSCGTSTAHSVPCMFSIYNREQYSDRKVESTENLLDVLHHAGINVLWRENNSDSKGVATRVEFQDYQKPQINTICDVECRDEGMLVGLQEYIDSHMEGDIMIVLHQMGNHGPAYYKRYPESFEKFTPVCRTNQFDECTNDEIINAYDNAILYTDYFLAQVVKFLKNNDSRFETAMVYLSDHGESLGEYGVYLHGLPYSMAPDAQKHIAALLWFGENFAVDRTRMRLNSSRRFSQDNLFHTILGMMEIESKVYDPHMDILHISEASEGVDLSQ